ncbi:lamin tail domain-containing protein [Nocardioides cavernaquae]|uniref:lamin tail domain-containing protein n=1 Tax=Nocardioides cavernaquae TaxID=2321396 RepID=UPI001601B60C|nr:lamin tail domain-containing protein [Nocardioides cavernaquae]
MHTSLRAALVAVALLPIASVLSPANAAVPPGAELVKVNEVESSGGTPGDWIELHNTGTATIDLSGFRLKDSAKSSNYTIPSGTTIAAGAYRVFDESVFGFGLGASDQARLFAPDGTSLVDSTSWSSHASVTWGRCPNGTGAFATTLASTKGAANSCSTPVNVKINEVESNGGTPGDWVEIINNGSTTADLSGYVFKDDANSWTLPSGSTVVAGGYRVIEEAQFGFGLGAPESAKLYQPGGSILVDSTSWSAHAATTLGRCPNGTGAFEATAAATKAAANSCSAPLQTQAWPGSSSASTVDPANALGTNMSGLAYEGSGSSAVLWAAKNGVGTLHRLTFNGTNWAPSTGWTSGKVLHYPSGTGDVDAEGVTFANGSASGVYVAAERDNGNSSVSRNSILSFDVSGSGSSLNATREWNLTSLIPATSANTGFEAVSFIPNAALVAKGFVDATTGAVYDPASYADHAGGLFFAGVEQTGDIHAFALNHTTGTATKVATIDSPFIGVMDLSFDTQTGKLWAACDDNCTGRSAVLDVNASGAFAAEVINERPTGMANLNNEGFTLAPAADCVAGSKPVFWSDDSNTGGFAIRKGSITC